MSWENEAPGAFCGAGRGPSQGFAATEGAARLHCIPYDAARQIGGGR